MPSLTRAHANRFASNYYAKRGEPWRGLEKAPIAAGLGADLADACVGDAGGPLLNSDGTQVGLGSYGLVQECGTEVNIGFYTSVGFWRTWIDNTLSFNNLAG